MISVIIPAKDAANTLDGCLRAMSQQDILDLAYEVIVVDDGSTDDTALIARRHDVRVQSQSSAGAAAARNAGADLAQGEFLAFTDSDCEPTPGWLKALYSALEDPEVVAVKGTYRTRQKAPVARFVQQEYTHKYNRLEQQTNIDFVDTYSAMYRRKVFMQNGGFDTTFDKASAEDADLSFRLARKGYKMAYVPKAVVYHQHVENLWGYIGRKFGYGYWRAYIYSRMPEKVSGNSHTSHSLRWQIPLFGLGGAALLAGFFVPQAWIIALACLLLFLLADAGLLLHIAREDVAILPLAIVMLLARTAALSSGLLLGFLRPPKPQGLMRIGPSLLERALKRLIDVLGALVGLLFSAPILPLAGLAIKLESPGPIFYRQERVGEGGRRFKILKLRSMHDDNSLGSQEQDSANLNIDFLLTEPDDPRITRVGRVIRRWSLDELPQFWNVLIGDMSLVGPRPEVPWAIDQLEDWERVRMAVKPGLTGPVQISGRKLVDVDTRRQMETAYVRDYSILNDLRILLRSILAVLSGRGAF